MADNEERQCLSCHEKELLILACNDNSHHLCLQCLLLWLRSKTNEGDSLDYHCPLYSECQSSIDPDILNDILVQLPDDSQEVTAHDIQKLSVSSAVRRNKTVSCPNPNCSFFWTEDEGFMELFANCSACKVTFCLTCDHILGQYSYRDHVCPQESGNERITVAEILSEASTFRCKNQDCDYASAGTSITKQEGDCNVIRCTCCNYYYCFICTKSLGSRNMKAHESFPHKNLQIPEAPPCWLFDDISLNQTTEEALNLRKLYRLSEYFCSLPISRRAKQVILTECRDLVGDLIGRIVLDPIESPLDRCTIL